MSAEVRLKLAKYLSVIFALAALTTYVTLAQQHKLNTGTQPSAGDPFIAGSKSMSGATTIQAGTLTLPDSTNAQTQTLTIGTITTVSGASTGTAVLTIDKAFISTSKSGAVFQPHYASPTSTPAPSSVTNKTLFMSGSKSTLLLAPDSTVTPTNEMPKPPQPAPQQPVIPSQK